VDTVLLYMCHVFLGSTRPDAVASLAPDRHAPTTPPVARTDTAQTSAAKTTGTGPGPSRMRVSGVCVRGGRLTDPLTSLLRVLTPHTQHA
jgi:hypothetical protein